MSDSHSRSERSVMDGSKVGLNALGDVWSEKAFGQDLYLASENGLELELYPSEIIERRSRRGLDQNVQIAPLGIVAACGRTEYPGITHAMALQDLTNLVAMRSYGNRRSHRRVVPKSKA